MLNKHAFAKDSIREIERDDLKRLTEKALSLECIICIGTRLYAYSKSPTHTCITAISAVGSTPFGVYSHKPCDFIYFPNNRHVYYLPAKWKKST
jgi:hypothetical protein